MVKNLKSFLFILKKKNLLFLIGLALTLSLLWPLFASNYFSHHDDVQIIRLHQMHECIKDFQIPCRWVPDLGGLYGYPLFNYYAPLPYYFGEIFYLLTGSLIFSVKAMLAVSFVGAYVFMYLLGRRLWGNEGGVLSGIFYSFAPYHAVDFYVRGAMGEMWAFMFFPAILLAILKLEEKTNLRNVGLIAVSSAALIMSHNISAMIFTPVLIGFAILHYLKRKKAIFIPYFLISIFLGLVLSAFYWLPAAWEKDLVHVETTTVGYFSYTEHFKGLRKLFLDRSWGWGPSLREIPGGEKDAMSYQIGWVHVAGWFMSLLVAAYLFVKGKKWYSYLILFGTAAIAAGVFMIHPRSVFVWNLVPPLRFLQFPWRFLILITLFTSLLSGSVFLWIRKKFRALVFIIMVSLAVGLNFSYFRPEKFLDVEEGELLRGLPWDRQIKRSIFDYLPIYAKAPPAELADKRYEVLEGVVEIHNLKERSNRFSFEAEVENKAIIRLSKYYFPDWKVFRNGQELDIDYNNDLGLITFSLDKGMHRISGRLFNTPIRTLANITSALGVGMIGFLFVNRRYGHS